MWSVHIESKDKQKAKQILYQIVLFIDVLYIFWNKLMYSILELSITFHPLTNEDLRQPLQQ
jgi:accessory gene regulator protein AgrB